MSGSGESSTQFGLICVDTGLIQPQILIVKILQVQDFFLSMSVAKAPTLNDYLFWLHNSDQHLTNSSH